MISETKIIYATEDFVVNNLGNNVDISNAFKAGVQWAIDNLKFVKPSFEEIRAEFIYKGGTNDLAEQFWNHYETNNWMVGKVKMKKWTSAVAQWVSREKKTSQSSKLQQNMNHVQRNMR